VTKRTGRFPCSVLPGEKVHEVPGYHTDAEVRLISSPTFSQCNSAWTSAPSLAEKYMMSHIRGSIMAGRLRGERPVLRITAQESDALPSGPHSRR
jgi:hypothetical protein